MILIGLGIGLTIGVAWVFSLAAAYQRGIDVGHVGGIKASMIAILNTPREEEPPSSDEIN